VSHPRPWTREARRTLIADRWLTLHAATCRTPDGLEITPYYVTEPADWVQVVALDGANNVLLIEQYRHAAGIIALELPGGCVDAGETPEMAGARELLEETGCAGGAPQLLVSLWANPATQTNRCHTCLIEGVRAVAAPTPEPAEEIALRWTPIDAAVRLAMSGGFHQTIHVAALAIALGRLGRWHV
jgi:8-oxo-dGDP phosphatase